MKRREFIMLVGGTVSTWPLAARAQQPERVRRIGVLMGLAADDAEGQARIAAFVQALQELGWSNGRNVRIDIRRGAGDAERSRSYAAELVALTPDVILASGGTVVGPLLQLAVIQAVAPSLRMEVTPVNRRDAGEIEHTIAAFARLQGISRFDPCYGLAGGD